MTKFEHLVGQNVLIRLSGQHGLTKIEIEGADADGIWFRSKEWEESIGKSFSGELKEIGGGENLVFFLQFSRIDFAIAVSSSADARVTTF